MNNTKQGWINRAASLVNLIALPFTTLLFSSALFWVYLYEIVTGKQAPVEYKTGDSFFVELGGVIASPFVEIDKKREGK